MLSDSKLHLSQPFTIGGVKSHENWQEITKKGLNRRDNASLDKAISELLGDFDKQPKMIVISDATVRVKS